MGLLSGDSRETLSRLSALEKGLARSLDRITDLTKENRQLKILIDEANKRSPDFEKESRQSAKKVTEFKNKANAVLDDTIRLYNESLLIKTNISDVKKDILAVKQDVHDYFDIVEDHKIKIDKNEKDISDVIETITVKIKLVEELFDEHPDVSDDIETLENFYAKTEENFNKSGQLLKNITGRKVEIDKIHREIFGYEDVDDDLPIHVNGLKDELEIAYTKIDKHSQDLSNQVSILEKNTYENFEKILTDQKKRMNSL